MHRIFARNLLLASLLAGSGNLAAQDMTSMLAPPGEPELVIGTGNFVTDGYNTRIKTSATQFLLCTTPVHQLEVCAPIVARSTMDGIAVSTSSAPDGTALVHFALDRASPRDPVNLAYAVARFLGRMTIAADTLTGPARSRANAPGTSAAVAGTTETDKPKKCSDLTVGLAGQSAACSDGGDSGIPNAGTVTINAPYQSPDPAPDTDQHGDPIPPPPHIPVVFVPGPRVNDAPIIIPVPEPAPPISYPDSEVPPTARQTAWPIESAPCIITPVGYSCIVAAKRPPNPNAMPPVPGTSSAPWWAWWKWAPIEWCQLIGYACPAKDAADNSRGENAEHRGKTIEQLYAVCFGNYETDLDVCNASYKMGRDANILRACKGQAAERLAKCQETARTVTGNGSNNAPVIWPATLNQ